MKMFLAEQGIEVGCDEAGRGCIAGPVCASAVILDKQTPVPAFVRDSKQLSAMKRTKAANWIKENAAFWAVGFCSPREIDHINILHASIRAMHRALEGIPDVFDRILVDGNYFHPYLDTPHHCIIKGDQNYACIAAASILAKVMRDDLMIHFAQKFPGYGWERNKGYPTKEHKKAVASLGCSPHHRRSFQSVKEHATLFS